MSILSKKSLIVISMVLIAAFSIGIFAQTYWGGKTMSAVAVKKKWGSDKFDIAKFKLGSDNLKSKMAYSLMTNKTYIGKSYEEIRKTFGPNDGFYFIDTYPAYIIQRGKNKTEDTWQLVFRMTNDYKVRDIIMHKNCCER